MYINREREYVNRDKGNIYIYIEREREVYLLRRRGNLGGGWLREKLIKNSNGSHVSKCSH